MLLFWFREEHGGNKEAAAARAGLCRPGTGGAGGARGGLLSAVLGLSHELGALGFLRERRPPCLAQGASGQRAGGGTHGVPM